MLQSMGLQWVRHKLVTGRGLKCMLNKTTLAKIPAPRLLPTPRSTVTSPSAPVLDYCSWCSDLPHAVRAEGNSSPELSPFTWNTLPVYFSTFNDHYARRRQYWMQLGWRLWLQKSDGVKSGWGLRHSPPVNLGPCYETVIPEERGWNKI